MKKEELIKQNEKLIWKIANSFYGVDLEDLFQAGVLGILKAYKNYKKNGTTKFSTYAYDYIFGEMYNLANNRSLKVSKDILKRCKLIEKSRYYLAQKLMREPSNIELAKFLNMDLRILETTIMSGNKILSLDDDNEDTRSLHETLAKEQNIEQDDLILLNSSFSKLSDLEKNIINSRYYEDLTQSEIADKLGISQVKVSRYEKKSLIKMREYMHQ